MNKKYEIGYCFGDLKIIGEAGHTKNNRRKVKCKCVCGTIKDYEIGDLIKKSDLNRSCGCKLKQKLQQDRINKVMALVGKKYGLITVSGFDSMSNNGTTMVKYVCDCGKEGKIRFGRIGKTISCGCHIKPEQLENYKKDLLGTYVNDIEILDIYFKDVKNVKYVRKDRKKQHTIAKAKCHCGSIFEVELSRLHKYKSCGCNRKSKRIKTLSQAYLNTVKYSALIRTLDFNITLEQVWELYEKQDKKCALSGLEIVFDLSREKGYNQTASIDRIDSTKGYTLDNIQIIHKDINRMKSDLDQNQFFDYIKLIYNKRVADAI